MFPRLDYYRPNPYFYGGCGYRYGYNGYGCGYNPYLYPSYYNNIPPPSTLPYYISPYAPPITPLQLAYQQNYGY